MHVTIDSNHIKLFFLPKSLPLILTDFFLINATVTQNELWVSDSKTPKEHLQKRENMISLTINY